MKLNMISGFIAGRVINPKPWRMLSMMGSRERCGTKLTLMM